MAPDAGKEARAASSRSKRVRLTCINCRNKKMRCDGGQPSCAICTAYGVTCQYDRPPPMSQVIAMAQQLRELESTVEELRNSTNNAPPRQRSPIQSTSAFPAPVQGAPSNRDDPQADMQLDHSKAYYHSTSAVDVPRGADTSSIPATSPEHNQDEVRVEPFDHLDIELWEEYTIANSALTLNLSPSKVRHLLTTHWTWVNPTFVFEDRTIFLRDGAVGGEFFSPLLLSAICLHATRFTDHELMDRLLSRTKIQLGQAIHEAPSLPTAQALLELSAHRIGKGDTSQAWLFGGMAFRMVIDLGLFSYLALDAKDAQQAIKVRIGRRLAWSCFMWDKALSLYLGRAPTLPNAPMTPVEPSNDVLDQLPWEAYGIGKSTAAGASNIALCFSKFCALGEIINEILLGLYSERHTEDASQFVKATRQKLELWWERLPSFLRIEESSPRCPNTHTLSLNLLYNAGMILLLRPFRQNQACREHCRTAARRIEILLLSLERTFGFIRTTYLMSYCAYIAATVAVQDVKDGIGGSRQRVDTVIRAMSAIRASCPGIQRSMDIVAQCLATASETSEPADQSAQEFTRVENWSSYDQMPTFPLNDFNLDFNVPPNNSVPFSSLEPFSAHWMNISDTMFDAFEP